MKPTCTVVSLITLFHIRYCVGQYEGMFSLNYTFHMYYTEHVPYVENYRLQRIFNMLHSQKNNWICMLYPYV